MSAESIGANPPPLPDGHFASQFTTLFKEGDVKYYGFIKALFESYDNFITKRRTDPIVIEDPATGKMYSVLNSLLAQPHIETIRNLTEEFDLLKYFHRHDPTICINTGRTYSIEFTHNVEFDKLNVICNGDLAAIKPAKRSLEKDNIELSKHRLFSATDTPEAKIVPLRQS